MKIICACAPYEQTARAKLLDSMPKDAPLAVILRRAERAGRALGAARRTKRKTRSSTGAIDGLVDADALVSALARYLVAADNEAGVRTLSAAAGRRRGRHAAVHLFPPSAALDRPYYTLLTTGASACRMKPPDGYDADDRRAYPERCEFMACLPADWPVAELGDGALTAGSWPRHMLCSLVDYVLRGNGAVHIGPNACIPSLTADPPGAPFFAGSQLAAVVTMDGVEEFELCAANDGLAVRYYYVLPLTAAEAAWKRRAGAAALYSAVGAKKPGNAVAIDYIIDNARACAVEDGKCDARYEAEQQARSPAQRAEAEGAREPLPLCYAADAPWKMMVSESEVDERVRSTEDTCIVDGEAFFLRGHIEVPLQGADETLAYNVWCSLSRASFEGVLERWDDARRHEAAPVFGWLSTELSPYPSTLNLKALVHQRRKGLVPLIELEPTEHPLAVEQRDGISRARLAEIARVARESPPR